MVTHKQVVRAATIAHLLRGRALEQPDRVGYTFLADGETDEIGMSYAETARRARAIATGIREAGGTPGTRVLLLLPPGLDYVAAFFGCTDAGVIAVPVYPPDPFQLGRTLPRLLAIVRDADPVIALTVSPLLDYLDEVTKVAPELGALRWLAVDTVPHADAGDVAVEPDAVAMLQYTSGSTAAPKGVMLSHANLLHNLGLIQRFFATSADTRALVWLPPYHDMGLIGGLLQPLYAGCPVTLMSPLHFLEQPMRWLRAIDRLGVTASGGPNFAYELLARKADPGEIARLNLSTWRVAFNGAEPIRAETMARFAAVFAPAGFHPGAFLPCYGLAEATLIVSGSGGRTGAAAPRTVRVDRDALARNVAAHPGDGPAAELTDCGAGADGQRIAIVDPATGEVCPDSYVGEVWVSGPSVARGYWRKPEESARVFGARAAGLGEQSFLRTGDLGFLRDGRLVVTGRLKDLIIVRGRNHYPQDVERAAERADPVLRIGCAAAFQLPAPDGEDRLAVVVEVRRGYGDVDVAGVSARIRQGVADASGLQVHMVTLIRAGGLPKTSSGKVQRRLCRDRLLAGELPEVARHEVTPDVGTPGDTAGAAAVLAAGPDRRRALLRQYLRARIAELTGAGADELDDGAPLLAAGLDSLAVVQLKHRLETDLAADLPLTRLLGGATLAEVADDLAVRVADPATPAEQSPVTPQPDTEIVAPMSHGQRWIWLVQLLEPGNTTYTIAAALRLLGQVDHDALRRALDAVVARHPALRTTFPVRDGSPVQVVHPAVRAAYAEHILPQQDDDQLDRALTAAARRPFDLESGPLLRVDLFRHPGGEVLLLAMHHIVTDFWSSAILARELGAYYTAYASGRDLDLATPRAGYLDVSAWRQQVHDDPQLSGPLERYWAEQLGDDVPRLALAADPHRSGPGGVRSFSLSRELAEALRARAATENVTMYVLLLAAFQSLLHRVGEQDDLAVGAALAGRTRPAFADVVGCCTTTALIRSHAAAGDTFRQLLARTRDQVIGALEHQDYPMTVVAERHRLSSRGSLVDVLFAYNRSPLPADDLAAVVTVGPPGTRRSLGSLQVQSVALAPEEGTLPLEVVMAEVDGVPYGLLRHTGGILDQPAAERLVEQFVAILEAVAADPQARLDDLLSTASQQA